MSQRPENPQSPPNPGNPKSQDPSNQTNKKSNRIAAAKPKRKARALRSKFLTNEDTKDRSPVKLRRSYAGARDLKSNKKLNQKFALKSQKIRYRPSKDGAKQKQRGKVFRGRAEQKIKVSKSSNLLRGKLFGKEKGGQRTGGRKFGEYGTMKLNRSKLLRDYSKESFLRKWCRLKGLILLKIFVNFGNFGYAGGF